jgi:hypothetical protein
MVICNKTGCTRRALFGFDNYEFCGKHKKCGMINLNASCIEPGCGKSKIYNYPGNNKGIYCAVHKKDNMINVKNIICIHEKCTISAGYNFPGEVKKLYCSTHKKNGMIDLKHKYCQFIQCNNKASFGIVGEKTLLFCSVHQKDGMENIKHSKCLTNSCNLIPSFNYKNETRAFYCDTHKDENMINVKHLNSQCLAKDINGEAYCDTRGNIKYDGYCTHCFANLFPLDSRTPLIRMKSKEIVVRNFINEYFKEFYHDKPLWTGGCDCTHRRRIDHRRLVNETLLCVGTDEFQHRGYDKYDEIIRYDDLMMIHGGKFIYIRFNPDSYRENGNLMNPTMEERLEELKNEIDKQIKRIENNENNDLLEIIYMFYNK